MHHFFCIAALFALTATSSVALAQVPPDIAEGIRKIGPINDPPGTAKLYAPLFADHKEPYPNVTVVRNIAYGTDPLQTLDVFTAAPTPGAPKPVVIFVHGGGFERGDKRRPDSPFYDNIMLWLTRQGMVGVNINHRLSRSYENGRWFRLSLVVETGDSVRDGAGESVGIGEGAVGELMLLEVAPASFDIVQFGGVFRQPFEGKPGARGERLCGQLATMDWS